MRSMLPGRLIALLLTSLLMLSYGVWQTPHAFASASASTYSRRSE